MTALSEKEVTKFFEQGYLFIPDVFGSEELQKLKDAFKRLEEQAQGLDGMVDQNGSLFVVNKREDGSGTQIKRIVWCGAAEPVLLDLGRDSRLTGIASQILGSSTADHIINQAHFKLPFDEVDFPFHQDSTHRGYGTDDWKDVNGIGSFVQMIIAVDEVTENNGPVLVIPESHSMGHLDLPGSTKEQTLSPKFNASDAVPVLMKPGSLALLHPYVIHGSSPNTSDGPRRIFINGFSYPGANSREYPGEGSGELISLVG